MCITRDRSLKGQGLVTRSLPDLYPLRFEPIFRRYLWGGRRLGTELGKPIGPGEDFAESWELVDHGDDQSVVAAGPLKTWTLQRLFHEYGGALFGAEFDAWQAVERPEALARRFPLLFKFLDCHRDLSIQIHPNDAQARGQSPPDLGKTEAWIVMHAAPGATVYAGLKEGVDAAGLRNAIETGRISEVLHRFEPRVGDCIFVPAGTVHGLGAGFLVAEIQQASDTTFRLYDWDRTDAQGRGRPLHIEESLAVLSDSPGPVQPVKPAFVSESRERLVHCDKFALDRLRMDSAMPVGDGQSFHLLAVLEGAVRVDGDVGGDEVKRGQTVLIPAACEAVTIEPTRGGATVLDIYWPSGRGESDRA